MNKILNSENIYKTIYEVGFFLGVDFGNREQGDTRERHPH